MSDPVSRRDILATAGGAAAIAALPAPAWTATGAAKKRYALAGTACAAPRCGAQTSSRATPTLPSSSACAT